MPVSLVIFRLMVSVAIMIVVYFGLSYVSFWPKGDAGDLLFMVLMAVTMFYLWRFLDRVSGRSKFFSWV